VNSSDKELLILIGIAENVVHSTPIRYVKDSSKVLLEILRTYFEKQGGESVSLSDGYLRELKPAMQASNKLDIFRNHDSRQDTTGDSCYKCYK